MCQVWGWGWGYIYESRMRGVLFGCRDRVYGLRLGSKGYGRVRVRVRVRVYGLGLGSKG